MKKNNKLTMWLLIGSALLSFILIITGRYVQDTYEIKVGQIAPKTIYAPRELENKIATSNKKEQVANSMEAQYKIDPLIEEEAKKEVQQLFSDINNIESSGESQDIGDLIDKLKARSPVPLYAEQYELLLDLSKSARQTLEKQILDILESTFNEGITSENQANIIVDIREEFQASNLAYAQGNLASEIVASVIRPNMTIALEETEALIQETVDKLDPVMVMTGEKIVDQGTKITEETYELVKAAGYIKDGTSNSLKWYLGAALIVILLASMFSRYMLQKSKKIHLNNKEKVLLFVLYSIGILIVWTFRNIKFAYIPITIIPMLVAILTYSDIAIILNMIIVTVGALICKGDIAYILYFLITGTISAISVINVRKRNKTFSIAAYLGLASVMVITSLRLFTQGTIGIGIIKEGAGVFLIGILMVIIVVGSLPLWEIAFDIVTPIKLLELTNPNHELLKRLLLEATGTYHHSLLVANLAETAAHDIGADSLLAKVGGYYHDIGKLGYVNYFKENQIGDNPHDYLEPTLSAQIILSHVTHGEELANQYKLPKTVKDIIMQHHGTTLAQYFYIEALNSDLEEEVNPEDFQYKGPKPQTKEAAIVMLADVVEATVRSMMPTKKKDEKLEDIVERIVRQKLEDGQLDESELMIQDLDKITQAFNRILVGMYHDRITYPTKEKSVKV